MFWIRILMCFLFFLGVHSGVDAAIMTDTKDKSDEYTLVNDFAKIMTKEQTDALEKDLRYIVNAQKKEMSVRMRLYFFTTDIEHGGLSEAERKLLGNAKIDSTIAPVLMIFDNTTQKFLFVVDERIESFVSENYVQSLFIDRKQPYSYDDFREIGIRLASIISLTMENGLGRQQKVPAKEELEKVCEVKFANFSQYVQERKPVETPPPQSQKEEETGLPLPIIFISIVITAIAAYRWFLTYSAKRAAKNKQKQQ